MIGRTIDRYKIVDKLGEGGMGAVYKAEDSTLNRLVALKTLSPHLAENEEARKRFIREAQAASAINHPNITTIHDLIADDDDHYICMEYVEGKTIRDIIESGQVSIRKGVDIIQQAALALEAAHRKGILHRDVKSANIMVSMEGNVKVMDFGLAHLEDRSQLTRSGTTMGTLAYSSPEQLTGRPYDERSEIWSLGVVFYELLTKQLPFKSPAEGELLFSIINNEQTRPSELREDIPPKIESVLTRMLEKDATLRYQNTSELISDLQVIHRELETSTVHLSEQIQPAQRSIRQKALLLGGSLIAIGVIAVAVVSLLRNPAPEGPVSIYVLPFQESGSISEDGLARDLTYEVKRLINQLFLVRAYSEEDQREIESGDPRRVGRDHGIDYLLEARVQRVEETGNIRIFIYPELINTSDGSIQSLEECSGILGEGGLFRIQTELANGVATELGEHFDYSAENLSQNDDAYALYMQARSHYPSGRWAENVQFLKSAVEKDPDFAEAWAELSWTYTFGTFNGSLDDADNALLAAQEAIRLNPELPESQHAMGYYHWFRGNYDIGVTYLERAASLNPNWAEIFVNLGSVYARLGRWEEASAANHRAIDLDPTIWYAMRNQIEVLALNRRYDEAENLYRTYLENFTDLETDLYSPTAQLHYEASTAFLMRTGNIEQSWQRYMEYEMMETRERRYGAVGPLGRLHCRLFAQQFAPILTENVPMAAVSSHHQILFHAELAYALGDMNTASVWYDSLLSFHSYIVPANENQHGYARAFSDFGKAYAGTGQYELAIEYGERAVALWPASEYPYDGWILEFGLAEILVLAGEHDRAIEKLEYLLSIPAMISAAVIRVDPMWNDLWDNLRFIALLDQYN
ncbi:protein kinase [Gemmatimonadota bacterium]